MALIPANALMSAARDEDEQGRALVTLYTGREAVRQGMMEYCTNARQQRLCAKPSIDIEVFAGRVDPAKVRTRPGYLNAILIQSRGRTGRPCAACRDNENRGPFIDCRRVPGYFEGCCGNCKWRDHAARCSARRPNEESDDEVPAVGGPAGPGGGPAGGQGQVAPAPAQGQAQGAQGQGQAAIEYIEIIDSDDEPIVISDDE